MLRRLLLLTLLAVPSPAVAQPAPPVTVTFNNGLVIVTPDGANQFQIGTLIELDGRFGLDDPLHEVGDTFAMRRVRPIFQGRAAKYFEFRVMPDFGNGQTVLFDAYFDVRFSRTFRVRIGKDKTPLGLEQLYSDYALLLPERTLVTNLVPNRDVGVQIQGDIGGGVLSYIGGVFNGIPDGTNGDVDADTHKDLAGRLTARPFTRTKHAVVRGFGVAVGATTGNESGPLPSYRSTGQQTFFSYAPGAIADGTRTRVSPSVFYFYKSFGAFAEYAHNTQAVRNATTSADLTHTAWEVTASYVLTGEPTSERAVIPANPFDPAQHRWGAVQIVARYSRINLDPVAFTAGLASSTSNRTADATGLAATLYANAYVKYVLSFERTVFDDSAQARRPPEHALVFRLQLNLQPSL